MAPVRKNPSTDTGWFKSEPSAEMTLEDAIRIASLGIHFNFGSDVEARRRYYQRRSRAIHMLREAGYAVWHDPQGFGYIVETH
jgi:hypothetical protein